MAPPVTVPSARTRRYFTASVTSANLRLMPRNPASIIHSVAPGPPSVTATATPPMLPSPTVPDTAVLSAWNGVASPGCARLRIVAANDTRRVTEAAQVHELERERADDAAHDQPHDDER